MSARATSITDIPFPSVTICNINKGICLKYFRLKPYLNRVTFSKFNKARYSIASQFVRGSSQSAWLQNVCLDEYVNLTIKNDEVSKSEWEKLGEWESFKQYLLNISQPCQSMLLMCRYALDTFKCMDIFDVNLSDEGLCCEFFLMVFNTTFVYFVRLYNFY